jgi:hypothetical protein
MVGRKREVSVAINDFFWVDLAPGMVKFLEIPVTTTETAHDVTTHKDNNLNTNI